MTTRAVNSFLYSGNTLGRRGRTRTKADTERPQADQMADQKIKVRDLSPTAVRLSPDVRHALAREAAINGRSLHGEIVHRLSQSLVTEQARQVRAHEAPAGYTPEVQDTERALLTLFRKMSPEKQLSLLSLLK
jgi:hypothetical protein